MAQETGKTNTKEEKKRGLEATIWVAIITAIGTIAVALISSPLFEKWLEPKPTPSPATLLSTPTILPAATQVNETVLAVPNTSTIEVATPIIATIAAPEATATPTSNAPAVMHVIVTSNQTTGKAPLVVRFDARGSYVQAPDGTIYECRKGACRYSWYILLNGQQFARPDTTGGTLEFKFQKKGIYSISVYICHGSTSPTCGNDATLVIVN